MPISNLEEALAFIENGDFPPGVKALAKAVRVSKEKLNHDLSNQIENYLHNYLRRNIIDTRKLVGLIDAMHDHGLLSYDEIGHIIALRQEITQKNALALAVQANDVTSLNTLVKSGADVEARVGIYHYKPLALAVTQNHIKAARCLLKAGAEVTDEIYAYTFESRYICRPALEAILVSHFRQTWKATLLLLQQHVDVHQQRSRLVRMICNPWLMTASKLLDAKEGNDLLSVALKAEWGRRASLPQATVINMFHCAIARGLDDIMVGFMLDMVVAGISLHTKNSWGSGALHIAVQTNQLPTVLLLAEKILLQHRWLVRQAMMPKKVVATDALSTKLVRQGVTTEDLYAQLEQEKNAYITLLEEVRGMSSCVTIRNLLSAFKKHAQAVLTLPNIHKTPSEFEGADIQAIRKSIAAVTPHASQSEFSRSSSHLFAPDSTQPMMSGLPSQSFSPSC